MVTYAELYAGSGIATFLKPDKPAARCVAKITSLSVNCVYTTANMWKTGNIYFIAAISVIGGGLFGFDISSMSALITTQAYRCYFNQQGTAEDGSCLGPRPDVQGGIVASMAGGSWLGALVSGLISDFFGRKTTIQIGAMIW